MNMSFFLLSHSSLKPNEKLEDYVSLIFQQRDAKLPRKSALEIVVFTHV